MVTKVKFLVMSLYALLLVCMGAATLVEKVEGKGFAQEMVYGAWWFAGLWLALVLLSLVCLWHYGVQRRFAVALLHLSFVVILLGALLTHLTAREGSIRLRQGEAVGWFTDTRQGAVPLPFTLTLKDYRLEYYPGTDAVMDYRAEVAVNGAGQKGHMTVSMNRIGRVQGYRFCQSSYDENEQQAELLVSYDPWGIPLTYGGYLLLLLGLGCTLCSRRTHIRRLCRQAGISRSATDSSATSRSDVASSATDSSAISRLRRRCTLLLLLLILSAPLQAQKPTRIDARIADAMGQVAVLYNGRICPLHTAATDFVTKLTGRSSWEGYSANQVFAGWMIYYTEWETQPLIRIPNAEVRRLLSIQGEWASLRDFYTSTHAYKLQGKTTDPTCSASVRKAIQEADERVQIITMFYNSQMLRIFPLPVEGRLQWFTPGSTELPRDVPEAEFQFINHAMDHLVQYILAGKVDEACGVIAKIRGYQREKAGALLPSHALLRLEVLLSTLQGARPVVYLALCLSLLFCLVTLAGRPRRWLHRLHLAYVLLQTLYLTLLLLLRWVVSGHVPLGSGFETMLFMAWALLAFTLPLVRRVRVLLALVPVASSLCLLVATLAGGTPQITPLMPVLQSPLLALHVALVMTAYVLLCLLTLLALRVLIPWGRMREEEEGRLTALSRLLLYPAVALLALGIFVGAVWANISWGAYWSWDPKEAWALITLMVYAIPLHQTSLPRLRSSRAYHLYILLAFLSLLMTYFGVNYFLPGMHSYA